MTCCFMVGVFGPFPIVGGLRQQQEHLQRRGHISAMRALETEAGVQTEDLGEDASFLRALVLDGRWEDAITLIEAVSYTHLTLPTTPYV